MQFAGRYIKWLYTVCVCVFVVHLEMLFLEYMHISCSEFEKSSAREMQIVSDCKVKKHVKRIDYEVQDARRGNATEGSTYIYFKLAEWLQDYRGY